MRKTLLAVGVALFSIESANAALVTQNFTVFGTFTSGPVQSVTQTFTATYDPTVAAAELPVQNYAVDNTQQAFNQGVGLRVFTLNPFVSYSQLVLFGQALGYNQGFTVDDFTLVIGLQSGGPQGLSLQYSKPSPTGSGQLFFASNVAVSVQSSVPEPSSWAMMLGGFALVGGVLRRRTKLSVALAD